MKKFTDSHWNMELGRLDLLEEFGRGLVVEGELAAEHRVEDDSECPHVGWFSYSGKNTQFSTGSSSEFWDCSTIKGEDFPGVAKAYTFPEPES